MVGFAVGMDRAPMVKTGYWTNHEQSSFNQHQYTTSDRNNIVLQLVIGVLFGAEWPLLRNILTRIWDWIQHFRKHQVSKAQSGVNERTPLLGGGPPPANSLSGNSVGAPERRNDAELSTSQASDLSGSRGLASVAQIRSNPPSITQAPPRDETSPPSHSRDDPNSDHRTRPNLNDQINVAPNDRPASISNDQTGSLPNAQFDHSIDGHTEHSQTIQVTPPKSNKTESRTWSATIVSVTTLALFVCWAVAGSLVTTTSADSLGLSASKHCGSWSLKDNAGNEAMDYDDLIQAQKETRAGQYGRDCYGQRSVTSPDQCSFLGSRAVSYTDVRSEQPCPFRDINLCAGGGYSAIRLSTGLIEASVLGINSPNPPKFNRTTICVPLDLNQGFVREIPPDFQHRDYRYEYNLGPVNDSEHSSNLTFTMFGDPFKWDVPAYSVSVYEATPYRSKNYWTPIKELDVMYPGRKYLTLIFIATCRIIYKGPSKDYIFHAADQYPRRPGTYWNRDPRARPLACIDWNEVCTYDRKCSPMDEEHPEYQNKEYEFTRSALRKSTIFHAIQFRLGNALVAQESVGDFESLPLDPNQWIIEAKALYNTSLARAQFDAFDIDQGIGHEKGSYRLDTPGWARDKLCGMYRFQLTKGYTNINIMATVLIFVLVASLFVLGQETPWEFDDTMEKHFTGNWMVFDLLLWFLATSVYYLYLAANFLSRWAGHSIMMTVESWKRRNSNDTT